MTVSLRVGCENVRTCQQRLADILACCRLGKDKRIDLTTKKAWILRTGGFASVYQWYGPVDVINASIENCQLEPTVDVVQGAQKRSSS